MSVLAPLILVRGVGVSSGSAGRLVKQWLNASVVHYRFLGMSSDMFEFLILLSY